MVEEDDVFVGISNSARLQYDELKNVVNKASDSFNKFKIDNQKYEQLLLNLSEDLNSLHSSFEKIFNDLNSSETVKSDDKKA
ncbi:MAG: hypothetical protein CSMARM5_0117 [Candidatus Parvarchaeum acidophilus ARMAN-5_'5-way FS']|jgi:hypothetical protein|uniref:Uncharacterized protein n=1 Tax=Candidatus Parvarchaeum acidophilus ARMAN-5_'5-way FS' TaxID=994838 RepID=F2UU19_PARA5|nr:MAG: hypothetical protein CSMARM5_0117 [Candidatus Parvarchaeum acidophilus ARMAN-5_'5-way FS']